MAYYYVKSGLTGTGDQGRYASQQAGAFPTGTGGYPTIAAAFAATTAPTSGDFICVSDSHTNTTGALQTWQGATSGAALVLISVDDSNCENYSAGASEQASAVGGNDITIRGIITIIGIDVTPADYILTSYGNTTFVDSTISFFDGNYFSPTADGTFIKLINCTLDYKNAGNPMFNPNDGFYLQMIGGSLTSSAGGDGLVDKLTEAGFTGGGGRIELIGVDLSIIDGTIIDATGNSVVTDDRMEIVIDRCKLHANAVVVDESIVSAGSYVKMTNSSDSSAAAEYQFQYISRGGDVNEDTSFYRDGSTAFPDSSQKISLKCATDSLAVPGDPFVFDFPARYAELSAAASDKLTIYVLSSAALDDGDIWAEVLYPDGTNKQTPNRVESVTNAFDPFRTAGSLTTNTEAWTGRTTENRYQIDLDTSTAAGADCVPIIRVYVAKASATIYFCPTVEAS